MNKPTTTALYSLFVMLVFFGISGVIQSCGGKKTAEETVEDFGEQVDDLTDSYSEDEYFEDDDSTVEESTTDEEESSSYADVDEDNTSRRYSSSSSTSASSSPSPSPSPTRSTSPSPSTSANPYLIVAGNYLLEDNADVMIQELKRKGYQNAEKVVFDLSQYHSVIAGRYASRSVASSAAGELKRAGIDNYVIKKK